MDYSAYKIRWILSFKDPDDSGGVCGTTIHHGPNPATAALASAEHASEAVARDPETLQFFILDVSDHNQVSLPLSNDDLSTAMRSYPSDLDFEVCYRPLC